MIRTVAPLTTHASQMPRIMVEASFGDEAQVENLFGFMGQWVRSEKSLKEKDLSMVGNVAEKDRGPFLYWLLNHANAMNRKEFAAVIYELGGDDRRELSGALSRRLSVNYTGSTLHFGSRLSPGRSPTRKCESATQPAANKNFGEARARPPIMTEHGTDDLPGAIAEAASVDASTRRDPVTPDDPVSIASC